MRILVLLALNLCCCTVLASEPASAQANVLVSRDHNAPNACDVELYLNQQVVAKLGPGEQISLDLPSGSSSLAVALSPAGYCGGRGPQVEQSVLLTPGETRQYAIRVESDQVFLAPLPTPDATHDGSADDSSRARP